MLAVYLDQQEKRMWYSGCLIISQLYNQICDNFQSCILRSIQALFLSLNVVLDRSFYHSITPLMI